MKIPASSVFRAAQRLKAIAEKHPWRWVAAFAAVLFSASILRSLRAKMWVDELYTYYTMRQPSAADVIGAIREGCDGAAPLYALIVHALRPLLGSDLLAIRLPAAVGVCTMCVAVFTFAFRRLPALYAFVAMLLPANACLYWATEGRCYGLVLGCAAGALLAWQIAAEGRHRRLALPALAASLAIGIALHYYTVFLLLPLLAGELVRWRRKGRLDWPVLLALAIAPLVLVPHLPLIQQARQVFSASSLNVSLHLIPDFISEYYLRYLLLLLAPLLLLWPFPSGNAETGENARCFGLHAHEWVMVIALTFLPAFLIVVALFTIKAFLTRYVVYAALGFSILAAVALFRTARGNAVVAAAAVILLLASLGARIILHLARPEVLREGEAMLHVLGDAPADPSPILVADDHVFMELVYYADPSVSGRLVYTVSPELDRGYTNADHTLNMSALGRRALLRVRDYKDFLASYSRFLLAADAADWQVWDLIRSGYRVRPVSAHWKPGLFFVEAPSVIAPAAQAMK